MSDAPPTPAADGGMSAGTTASASPARFQRFRDRLAGREADTTLRRDIPGHLAEFLRQWISAVCHADEGIAQRVALRLGLEPAFINRDNWSYVAALRRVEHDPDLLDVVDAILAAHPTPNEFINMGSWWTRGEEYATRLQELHDALEDVGSAFTLDESCRQLVERVDPTVDDLVRDTTAAAPPTAGDLLRAARKHAYGLHPDPTAAYREAVRAVEEMACRLVLPKEDATLGKVVAHLKQGGHKWRFVLVARDGSDDVAPLVAMLDRLWTGQVSRHGGGKNSRDQTPEEARAAVHLAATLVQLLSTGALTRRGQA